jgi:outer membrane protein insertion porin family
MRFRMAQVVTFAMACLLASGPHVNAQSCPTPHTSNSGLSSGPEISIAEVTFSGTRQLATSDQDQIAASIKEQTYGDSLDGATDGALERVRVGWQNHGYFKVQVKGYAAELDSTFASRRLALSVQVDEGVQYRLGGIKFKGNRAVRNLGALRSLFPIKDGDTFSREKLMTGLEDLHKAYGQLGYINFTPVPNTRFDDAKKRIYLDIDVDEGKQFFVDGINILGVDESFRAQMLQDFLLKPGQIYNGRLVELFLKREHGSVLSDRECNDRPSLQLDERSGLVTITFDFHSCLSGR